MNDYKKHKCILSTANINKRVVPLDAGVKKLLQRLERCPYV